MFDNIGGKVKVLAKVNCWIGIIASVIYGGVLISKQLVLEGVLVWLLGSFISWVASLTLYAIGETAENSSIAANLAAKTELERVKKTDKE